MAFSSSRRTPARHSVCARTNALSNDNELKLSHSCSATESATWFGFKDTFTVKPRFITCEAKPEAKRSHEVRQSESIPSACLFALKCCRSRLRTEPCNLVTKWLNLCTVWSGSRKAARKRPWQRVSLQTSKSRETWCFWQAHLSPGLSIPKNCWWRCYFRLCISATVFTWNWDTFEPLWFCNWLR